MIARCKKEHPDVGVQRQVADGPPCAAVADVGAVAGDPPARDEA
ncbi:MAG TPA: hypothetical protein VLW50_23560 [Streptosporangiaceae bacterium]|nr:hypothetical protein [Streptosporangiaceae bacterium]